MAKKNTDVNRRTFLKSGAVAVTALAAIGAGVSYLKKVKGVNPRSSEFLRPPGAIEEETFIYGCIKCGLCVQICPVQAIHLAGIDEAFAYSTPFIDPRTQACDFSCDSLQCVETCPTAVLNFKQFEEAGGNALAEYQQSHNMNDPGFNPFKVQIKAMKEKVKIGTARLKVETCLAFAGKGFTGTPRGTDFKGIYRSPAPIESRDPSQVVQYAEKASPLRDQQFEREICDLCVTECPIGEKAITFGEDHIPKVLDGCTGCGVCVMVCPTSQPSIIIEPANPQSHV